MKKFVPWLKANLIVVIALATAIIAAPLMIFFSTGWGSKVHKAAEARVSQQASAIAGLDVTYRVEPFLAGKPPVVDVTAPPNAATTERVKGLLTRIVDDVGRVRADAIERNSRGKRTILGDGADRLFPAPPDLSTSFRLLDQFVQAWPRAHADLLKAHHAGSPPSEESVRTALEKFRTDEVARITAGRSDQKLTADEEARLTDSLAQRRLDIYRSSSAGTAFYATPSVFSNVKPWPPSTVLPLETAWDQQMIYWVNEDLIKAALLANSDGSGSRLDVFRAPVKILESIMVGPSGKPAPGAGADPTSAGTPTGEGPATPPESDDERTELPKTFAVAHTGRASWPASPNPIYDLRYADVVLIAASKDVPKILDAFSSVNFMTVVGVDIADYDPLPDLRLGYDLGADHLVRVSLRVESAWLRAWLRPLMPAKVREALGVPPDAPPPAPPGEAGSEEPPSEESESN
ncbi:MAG TPA: hypothetical protein DEB06_07795 [Phycisphaerales bacterium]|nr:hypothetical protein [Phycisphaerales bacterium]